MKRLIPILALFLVTAGGGSDSPSAPAVTTTSAPYSQTDFLVGAGATATTGSLVTVAYAGWLHDSSKPDAKGSQFDANTISFRLGTGAVIAGWDQGLLGMRVGGQRRLVIGRAVTGQPVFQRVAVEGRARRGGSSYPDRVQ